MNIFKINFTGYDELLTGNFSKPKQENVAKDSISDYFTTRYNTKKINYKDIDAENELSGRNFTLTKSGMQNIKPLSSLGDNRPVILDTPQLFHSAYKIKDKKTCNSTTNLEYNRLSDLTEYQPHPSVYYQPNTFLGSNSRQIRRNDYLLRKK